MLFISNVIILKMALIQLIVKVKHSLPLCKAAEGAEAFLMSWITASTLSSPTAIPYSEAIRRKKLVKQCVR